MRFLAWFIGYNGRHYATQAERDAYRKGFFGHHTILYWVSLGVIIIECVWIEGLVFDIQSNIDKINTSLNNLTFSLPTLY